MLNPRTALTKLLRLKGKFQAFRIRCIMLILENLIFKIGIKMLITHETLDRFKTSNKLFDGVNVSLEAKKVLKEQKYKVEREYDIFLSHSFQDAENVYALYKYLKSFGWSVYVDWIKTLTWTDKMLRNQLLIF